MDNQAMSTTMFISPLMRGGGIYYPFPTRFFGDVSGSFISPSSQSGASTIEMAAQMGLGLVHRFYSGEHYQSVIDNIGNHPKLVLVYTCSRLYVSLVKYRDHTPGYIYAPLPTFDLYYSHQHRTCRSHFIIAPLQPHRRPRPHTSGKGPPVDVPTYFHPDLPHTSSSQLLIHIHEANRYQTFHLRIFPVVAPLFIQGTSHLTQNGSLLRILLLRFICSFRPGSSRT